MSSSEPAERTETRTLLAMRVVPKMVALACVVAVAACSAPGQPPVSGLGTLDVTDGIARITVPALWAAKGSDGSMTGGVEPAGIDVTTTSRNPDYSVDLADIEARGAGPAWRAATSMAAAFGTIFVGADPDSVDYHFTISGPIDGPSAGGILTVGIIAAFRGASLKPGATMTGTITADGSIGNVGGVPTKIEAAAREGYDTVIVPASLRPDDWDTGNDLTALADSLGVTLVPVFTIGDAYAAMTDEPVADRTQMPGRTLPWPAPVRDATVAATSELIDELEARLASGELLDDETAAAAAKAAASAREDLADGQTARAYGRTVLALSRVSRVQGGAAIERVIQQDGLAAAIPIVRSAADELLSRAEQALRTDAATPVTGLEQQVALPVALSWASFTQVTMLGLIADLKGAEPSAAEVVEMGRVIGEEALGLDWLLPDAIDVVRATPSNTPVDSTTVATQMSDYSEFLLRASEAGEAYLADVLGVVLDTSGTYDSGGFLAGAVAAATLADTVTPVVDPYQQEAQQLATALTYFWLVSYAQSAIQAYGEEADIAEDVVTAGRQQAMDIAIDTTWWFVELRAGELSGAGVDASAATWSAAWATEASLVSRDTDLATAAGWLAQGELWYDSVQVMMLISAVAPATIAKPVGDG